jgi:thiamine-phosphate pyrophosphorylase
MAGNCLLYYITGRTAFPGNEVIRRRRLLQKISEAARAGVDYVQLREKDLCTRDLESLAREAVQAIRESHQLGLKNREARTVLLINSRTDIALAVGADGVHLRADDVSPENVRKMWRASEASYDPENPPRDPIVGVSCHSPVEVSYAAAKGATFAVFAPVFEKKDSPAIQPTGLTALAEACHANIRVLALGGVTLANARSCLDAGAAGIAAIRLFQENPIAEIVANLKS